MNLICVTFSKQCSVFFYVFISLSIISINVAAEVDKEVESTELFLKEPNIKDGWDNIKDEEGFLRSSGFKEEVREIFDSKSIDLRLQLKETKNKQEALAGELSALQLITNQIRAEVTSQSIDAKALAESKFSIVTIVLTSVAVLVTVMGVIIAIMAFYGYKEIIQKAGEKAEKIAREQSEEISKRILLEQVEKGVFDEIINDNIEKIALRGVMSGRDLDLEQREKD